MIKAYVVASHEVSDASPASALKHRQSLFNRHGLYVTSTKSKMFHLTLVADCNQDVTDTVGAGTRSSDRSTIARTRRLPECTHGGDLADLDANLSGTQISLPDVSSEPSQEVRQAFEDYLRQGQMGMLKQSVRNALAHDWLPPILVRWLSQVRGGGIRFEGDFGTWGEAKSHCTGYDAEEIVAKVLASTLKVKNGEAESERDSVLFDQIEYAWPVLAGLMWVAARSGGGLTVLDFGGSLGSSYFQNRKFLQSLPNVRWCVVEQAHFVEAGRDYIQDTQLRFYKTIEECLSENQPNLILLSGVLQYLESPADLIGELNKVGALCLVIDRTPFSSQAKDKLVVQKVPASIYSASYPFRIFSLYEFEKLLARDWVIMASNLSLDGHVRTTSNFEFSFQGFCWRRKDD